MAIELKSTIVTKNVNDDVTFVLDLSDSADKYYKFEGVSSLFIRMVSKQEPEEKIIQEVLSNYEGVTQEQIKTDLAHFVSKLNDLNFLR